jgi:hypothetical protein
MSFIDAQLHLHNKTVVTSATSYRGDSITLREANLLEAERRGEPLEVVIQITTAFASGTSANFSVITSAVAALTSEQKQSETGVIPTAQLTLGEKFRLPLHVNTDDTASFAGVMAATLGTHDGGSAFSAWIQRVGEDQDSYS